MEVADWFECRDAAYDQMMDVEDDPSSTDEDVGRARRAWHEVRWLLRKWKVNESAAWRREWRAMQATAVRLAIEDLRKTHRQPELGDET